MSEADFENKSSHVHSYSRFDVRGSNGVVCDDGDDDRNFNEANLLICLFSVQIVSACPPVCSMNIFILVENGGILGEREREERGME